MKMNSCMPGSVIPTMITPFTKENEIDYDAVEALVEYYIEKKCTGIFALCQSSETFFLTLAEKQALIRFILRCAGNRIAVIASAHTSDSPLEQLRELNAMAEAGVETVVLISNRLARPYEDDGLLLKNAERILKETGNLPLGIYECPYPYKRLLSPEVLRWCASSGRFYFLKDTCCDLETIERRCEILSGTNMGLYNANTATLSGSMRAGAAGYSGIMANYHADLYVKLMELLQSGDPLAEELQAFLTAAALIERQMYPTNAKYRRTLSGMHMGITCRSQDFSGWNKTFETEVEAVFLLEECWRKRLGLASDAQK